MSLIHRLFPEFRSILEPTFSRAFRPFPMDTYRPPMMDVNETEKEFVLKAQVPGLKKEELTLEIVNDNTLVIGGQSQQQDEHEAFKSDFYRSFAFPQPLDPEQIQAKLEHGILSVTIPKQVAKVNKIQIQ